MNLKKIIGVIIVVGAILAAFHFLTKYCGNKKINGRNYGLDSTVTVVDTTIYVSTPSTPDTTIIDTVEVPVNLTYEDSMSIFKKFYTRKKVEKTIVTDNEVKIKFTGEMFQNNLSNIQFDVVNYRATNQEFYSHNNNNIYAGLLVSKDLIAPTISYTHKKLMFTTGYNLNNSSFIFGAKYNLLSW